jgi:TolB-like protein/DNA-binding winged helix-turn-helix (wHTH) protein/tetratricopeptide (TPR) repeat protein
MDKGSKPIYEFGAFRLDPGRQLLALEGNPVALTSKAFEVLLVLVEHGEKAVSKEQLMTALWPDSFVEESNLTQHISVLRKALGETPHDHRYILTLPGCGYRFAQTVRVVSEEGSESAEKTQSLPPEVHPAEPIRESQRPGDAPIPGDQPALPSHSSAPLRNILWQKPGRWVGATVVVLGVVAAMAWWLQTSRTARHSAASTNAGRRTMLAVLPFQNLSNDPAQEYFSDGLTEETITDLGELKPDELAVIARTSAMAYKHTDKSIAEIGRELGADYILEGSVRREGGTARVSAQLIRVSDQTHLWAHTYEREVTGLLALQNELGTAIAQHVQIELEPKPGTRLTPKHVPNTEAYESYLQGLFFLNKRTYEDENKSVEYFERSSEKDPGFAPAYAGLANAYLALSIFSPEHFFPLAAAAATRALELDDNLAEAHAVLGAEKADFEFDWQGADRELSHAISLNPNSALSHFIRSSYYLNPRGKSEESVAEMKKALELDPLSPIYNAYLGLNYFYARQYDKALSQYTKTVVLFPEFHITHYWLAWLYSQRGQYLEAITEITKARLLEGGPRAKMAAADKLALTNAYAAKGPMGFWRQIQKANEKTGRNFGEFDIPQVNARLGEKDLAIEWLGKNCEARTPFTTYMNIDPAYDSLRSDPRFASLARRIGLTQ